MEHFFAYNSQPVFSWLEEEVPAKPSGFVSYAQHQHSDAPAFVGNIVNTKNHMSSTSNLQEPYDYLEKERSRQHMLSERMRREKQKHNYMRLHSLLPTETKVCVSIIYTPSVPPSHIIIWYTVHQNLAVYFQSILYV